MSTEMFEVEGTSYSTKTALYECNMVRDRYIDWAMMHGYEESSVRQIYMTMSQKERKNYNVFIDVSSAYPLIGQVESFEY